MRFNYERMLCQEPDRVVGASESLQVMPSDRSRDVRRPLMRYLAEDIMVNLKFGQYSTVLTLSCNALSTNRRNCVLPKTIVSIISCGTGPDREFVGPWAETTWGLS
ncbi:hypothetical protein EVAR_39391_1 [Eumeta japonica]|uniref:Uncharacterized protein n=1 Tax=Eumeta variegata TaxID=151549 RepID=A0A4C1T3P5_EUMVA|nr:hypothetical protein EVAR_39391_1 [Eumeta japonica]